MIIDADIVKELKEALEKEREKLIAELKSIARPNPQGQGEWNTKFPTFEVNETGSHAQKEEEADEVEEYEMRLAAGQSLESRLLEVNKALERMLRGTYGICKKCRKEIHLERLRANPAAEYHLEHI